MTSYKNKKRFILFFLIVFLFTASIGTFTPRIAKAQTTVLFDFTATLNWITDAIGFLKANVWDSIMSVALTRTYQMFMETLAYKAAEGLAYGAPGNKSLWNIRNWDGMLTDTKEAARAEFLDNLAAGVGIDICKPPSGINLQFKVGVNIAKGGKAPEPRCTMNTIKEKWGEFADLANDPMNFLKLNSQSLKQLGFDGSLSDEEIRTQLVKNTITVKESDIGFVQMANDEGEWQMEEALKLVKLERQTPDGPKPVTTPITKDIVEPAEAAADKREDIADTAEEAAKPKTENYLANIASIFLNTFVSQSMKGLMADLFKVEVPQTNYEDPTGDGGRSNYTKPRKPNVVDETFASINQIRDNIKNITDVDVITEMETDLGRGIVGEMNNRTIDSDFSEVLRKAQGGQTLTLREGIEENLVDENKWFGYIDVASQDPKQPDVNKGFSANNIKKLVKNRVVSVGWQFAAEIIKTTKGEIKGCSAQGCTLKTVMDHYDRSGTYEIDGIKYKNEYCGWRPISAEPYFIDITNGGDCATTSASLIGISGVEVQWTGNGSLLGTCYKYEDTNEDTIIDNISPITVVDQEDCEGNEPSFSAYDPVSNPNGGYYYYEWEPGGCMIKELDESSLCHLVDPNTVLKAPAQQCGAEGYYSILEVNESSSRQKDCADVKHCIKEDDQGQCVGGYDYCTKEENIWRFNGDSCNKQYNSCTTLIDDERQQESYLINTLKDCPQEEVGCRDYITEKQNINNEYVWDNNAQRIYFNNSVEKCGSGAAGCSEFIEIEPGVNLVPNGSFEINDGPEDLLPDGWGFNAESNYELVDDSYQGQKSIYYSSITGGNASTTLNIASKGLYTLSYYAKSTGAPAIILPKIKIYFNDGSSNQTVLNDAKFEGSSDWVRKSGYFSVINLNNKGIDYLELIIVMNGNIYIDAIQFELNKLADSDINTGKGSPSAYKEYGKNSKEYFKKAPDYLNCEDYSLNSYNCGEEYHPCCDYVKYCPVEDLSCSAYYPTNGDPFVPAVINDDDQCVAECNNYQTFTENYSYFDELENNTTTTDRNFIPDTAQDCSEPSCELFTNIDKLESGAESKEYYSFVRQCVKPDDSGVSIELYYTWEGSDTSAFQLKTWKLLASEEEDTYNLDSNKDPQGGFAPCTNIEIGGTSCADDANNIIECNPEYDLNCRTFYDENAVPHNRLLSKTIPITEECINLRRELSNQTYKIAPSMSQTCGASNVGCRTYKGNNSDNVRNIFIEDFESGSVSGWMADAVNANNEKITNSSARGANLEPSSEAIHYNGNSMKVWVHGTEPKALWVSYNLTQAGLNIIPNKQYSLSFWAKAFADNNAGKNYALGNEALNLFPATVASLDSLFYQKALAEGDPSLLIFDNTLTVINQEWLLYNYDITDFETDKNGDVILSFKININNYTTTLYDGIFIDNILLKGFTNSFDKIKDSWETPRVCSINNYLGCQEYQDSNNNTLYLYQFSDLCPEENIGCTAMIDTQNSTMPWQQTFNAYCKDESDGCTLGNYYYKNVFDVSDDAPIENIATSTVIIPEDELVYIVKDDSHSCSLGNKGCQEMSVINNDLNEGIYLINNPDYYIPYDIYGGKVSILCSDEYVNCVSFADLDGSKLNKIHPRNKTCEYREEDTERNTLAGFYDQDGNSCLGLLYNKDYDNFTSNIVEDWKPYDDYNNQYAALCPPEENKCSGFIDPLDNLDFSDYVYSRLGINLNYNNPSEWKQAFWNKQHGGEIRYFDSNGISYHPASGDGDYDGLNVVLSNSSTSGTNARNLLIYRGPNYNKEAFFFNVESDTTYRLSAKVKLDDAESIMTFLSCRPSTTVDGTGAQTSIWNYFVSESWYENANKIPYAFPSIKSNYSVANNGRNEWQNIYGLYEILPGAHYCNLAFYINGAVGSKVTLADINLEKVEGDYYYLDNDSLDYKSCNSANLKKGCVLFQDITESGLKWNYENSYAENRLAPGDSNLRMPNDVNTLLKVTRDKQCAEWLTCGAYLKTIDPSSQQTKDACVSLIACDELSEKAGVCSRPFLHGQTSQPLTLDYYQQMRGKAGWSDLDYSGYSIPGLYPLDVLTPVEVVNNTVTSTVLGRVVVKQNSSNQPFVYKLGTGVGNYLQGIYNDPYPGTNWGSNLTNGQGLADKSCRLYPEKDSPFPWIQGSGIVTKGGSELGPDYIDIKTKSTNFANANICQTGTDSNSLNYDPLNPEDCECHYTKANYGSETLYFPYDYNDSDIPNVIDVEYGGNTTTTLKLQSKPKYLGWKGFCLDEEKSLFINNTEYLSEDMQDYRCLTWYPVDLLSGEIDAYGASQEADIASKVPENAKLCLIGEDWVTTGDRFYCGKFDVGGVNAQFCNVMIKIPSGSKVIPENIEDNLELLFGNDNTSNNGRTWLENGDAGFTYEDANNQSTGIIEDGGELSIIYKSIILSGLDHTNNDENLGGSNDNKYIPSDFNLDLSLTSSASYIDDDGLLDNLVLLFDIDGNLLEKYYYDERVDFNGETITGTLEKKPKIYFDTSVTDTGAECNDCGTARVEAKSCADYDTPMHQVRIDCDKSSTNCFNQHWRDAWRDCNPRDYNYYVNFISTEASYVGRCDYNCKWDGEDESVNHGQICLENNVDGYTRYEDTLAIYEVDPDDLDLCKQNSMSTFSISEDEALNDCSYVRCIEDVGLKRPQNDHICSIYKNAVGSCGDYIFNTSDEIISSIEMAKEHFKCLVGGQHENFNGLIGYDFGIGPGANLYNGEIFNQVYTIDCIVNPTFYSAVSNCYNCNLPPLYNCPLGCGCDTCELLAGEEYLSLIADNNCSSCAQTCKTYVTLDKTIYNSNNFYLNWLSPTMIGGSDVFQVCSPNNTICEPPPPGGVGDNSGCICPIAKSGNTSSGYNTGRFVRYDKIWEGSWGEVSSPFSSNIIVGNPTTPRDMIYTNGRPGFNDVFNDYYSTTNLQEAINRLEKVIVKVPNENFHEWDGSGWPMPVWTGDYWNETSGSDPDPIIEKVLYDGENGYSNGSSGITINNTNNNKHILGEEGNLYANLRFYAYTAAGATPIQEITINWTNDSANKLVLKGPFKNHKHKCYRRCGDNYRDAFGLDGSLLGTICAHDSSPCGGTGTCRSATWGDHPDACVEDNPNKSQDGFFSYSHIYTCDALNDYWHEEAYCQTYDSDLQGGCCIYTPSVTITDNWGNSKTENLGDCNNGNKTCSVIIVPR